MFRTGMQGWRAALVASLALLSMGAMASGMSAALDALTSRDAANGMRAALSQGIDTAVAQLGVPNGFLNDPKVAIPRPPALQKADRLLRLFGMGKEADDLRTAMNHAAEMAVAGAKPVFKDALQRMTLADAKEILTGADDAGTQYFRRATSAQLTEKFRPIVARETEKVRIAALYDEYAGQAADLRIITAQDANLNDYVTAKALDGLFSRIADEERAIRRDPLGQTSSLIRKVFGAVDVGSVKGNLVRDMERVLYPNGLFVGGHPIAGSDRSGIDTASAELFEQAKCIITPTHDTDKSALKKIIAMWRAVGCLVTLIDPDEHDRIYGAVSHLAHVLAYEIINTVDDINSTYLTFSGQGLKDTTRIASSRPELWRDICVHNRRNLLAYLEAYLRNLDKVSRYLREDDSESLLMDFQRARTLRENLGQD